VPDAAAANAALFTQFRAAHTFGPYGGHDVRQSSHRNLVIENVPLQVVHEELLTRYRVTRLEDSQGFGALLRLVQLHLIENPTATCTVFLMAEGNVRRRDYQDDQIVQLFQGRQYAQINGVSAISYPGDREIRGASGITVQMGYLDLGQPNSLVAQNVPYLAVWMPANTARDTLTQAQGG
jgi:hypothetical protein